MEKRIWRSVTITPKEFNVLRIIIKLSNIKYESSGCGDDVYVSLLVNKEEECFINSCLDIIYEVENA